MIKIEKNSKKIKIKHYFTLEEKINNIFLKFINDNIIDKQKLMEKLIINYLKENNINFD